MARMKPQQKPEWVVSSVPGKPKKNKSGVLVPTKTKKKPY